MSPQYLAGFLDGEGCIDTQFMYSKQAPGVFYVRPRVRVSQAVSGRIVLDKLQATFGGHLANRKAQNSRQQASVSWEILQQAGIRSLLGAALPYLILKREQALLVLWWLDNASGRYSGRGHRPDMEMARRIFAEELSQMKSDPQRLSGVAVERIAILMR
jgi:hypothetical protein